MFWERINPDLLAVCLLGGGAPVLGLAGLLVRRPAAWHRRALVVAVIALGSLGAAAAAGGQPRAAWLAPALLAGLCGLCLALASPGLDRACAWVLGVLRLPRL